MSEHRADTVAPSIRTVAYVAGVIVGALVLLTSGLAPIFLDGDTAAKVIAAAGVVSTVTGTLCAGLGVAYRPTRPDSPTPEGP